MRIENTIINCMQAIHNDYFITEMVDHQSYKEKEEQKLLHKQYTALRNMLVFYTDIPYRIKSYGDRLDIMYFDYDTIIKELNPK